jgi:hypothetical protein
MIPLLLLILLTLFGSKMMFPLFQLLLKPLHLRGRNLLLLYLHLREKSLLLLYLCLRGRVISLLHDQVGTPLIDMPLIFDKNLWLILPLSLVLALPLAPIFIQPLYWCKILTLYIPLLIYPF